jgi:hypothetical protein
MDHPKADLLFLEYEPGTTSPAFEKTPGIKTVISNGHDHRADPVDANYCIVEFTDK